MSYEFGHGQNPSTTIPNFPPKIVKQIVAKNKSTKRSRKTNANNVNSINNSNSSSSGPLKVVYISNPIKFQVNADGFQTLVQELTGRDALEWTDENYNKFGREVVNAYDEVMKKQQQEDEEPPLDDQQVDQMDAFGPLDGVVCGNEDNHNNGYMIDIDYFQDFVYGNGF